MNWWLDVTKTLIGTGVGSALGLMSALLVWRVQQRRFELAAGNVTVIILGHYLGTLKHINRAVSESKHQVLRTMPAASPWMSVLPIHTTLNRDLKIDPRQLSFLSDEPQLLERLLVVERLYFDLIATVDDYNSVHKELQAATSEHFKPNEVRRPEEIERAVGTHRVAQANSLLAGIEEHLRRDEQTNRTVAAELTSSLERRYGRSLILRRKQKIARFQPNE